MEHVISNLLPSQRTISKPDFIVFKTVMRAFKVLILSDILLCLMPSLFFFLVVLLLDGSYGW